MTKYNRKWQHKYNDPRWVKGRLRHLRENPLCVYCKQVGISTAVYGEGTDGVVDHIIPHKGNDELFFDDSNWQSLCKPCHDGPKQMEESRGYQIGHGADGMPLGRHPWNEEE